MTDKVKLEIELDFSTVATIRGDEEGHGPNTLEDMVVSAAAHLLLKQTERGLEERMAQYIDDEFRVQIGERVTALMGEALKRSLTPTDTFGQPKGDPITIEEAIVQIATKELTQRVDRYNHPQTLISKVLKEHVERGLSTELTKAIEKAKAEVMAAVKEKGAEVLASTISRMAGVR